MPIDNNIHIPTPEEVLDKANTSGKQNTQQGKNMSIEEAKAYSKLLITEWVKNQGERH